MTSLFDRKFFKYMNISNFLRPIIFKKQIYISSILFLGYFLYTFLVWLYGCFDFACRVLHFSQCTVFSRVLGILVLIFLIIKGKNLFQIERLRLKSRPVSIVCVCIIFLFSIIRIVYVDGSWDTIAYHLIAQQPGFFNYFKDSNFLFPTFQVLTPCLSDKLFWYFRFLLGYRIGTVLNSLSLLITYFQVITLLDLCFEKNDKISEKFLLDKSFWALLIVLSAQQALMLIGTYMVDLLSLPFLMEICIILLQTKKDISNKNQTLYFAVLIGFAFLLKLTNIVFIMPVTVLYIVIIRKTLDIRTFILCAFFAIIPILPYMAFTMHITGNPVYPFFNAIFKSDLYPIKNFKDPRWGPSNKKELLLWPIYLAFKPGYRQSEISQQYNLLLKFGVLGFALKLFQMVKVDKKSLIIRFYELDFLAIIFIFSAYCWSLTTGYSRYYLIGHIFYGVFAYYLVHTMLNNCFFRSFFNKSVTALIIIIICFQCVKTIKRVANGYSWKGAPFSISTFRNRIKNVFRDRNQSVPTDADLFLIVKTAPNPVNCIPLLISPNTQVIDTVMRKLTPRLNELYWDKINSIDNIQEKNIYDIKPTYWTLKPDYLSALEELNFGVAGFHKIKTQIRGDCYLIKLKYDDRFKGKMVPFPLELGRTISFSSEKASYKDFEKYNFIGLVEEADNFYSLGNRIETDIKIQSLYIDKQLPVTAKFTLANVFLGKQHVVAKINEKTVFDDDIHQGDNLVFDFIPPKDGIIHLTLDLLDAASPKSLGINEDPRVLGISITDFSLNHGSEK